MTPRIEEMVVKYTRKIHPQDLGKETCELENTLRQALTEAYQAGIDEAVEIVDGIRNDEDVRAHQSNDNFKHYAVGVLDRVIKALQDNK